MSPETSLPASSDAEIRAYLRPLLKAGTPPTYKAMRATLGGGFSRLARIKKQVERELGGDAAAGDLAGDQVSVGELVAALEALFDRQWKAIEEWERRSLARLPAVPSADRALAAARTKVAADTTAAQADRLESVERRLVAIVDKLQAMTNAPAAPSPRTPSAAGILEEVPPTWARQAAAAATAALDGRLQSIEETMRDTAVGARGAFEMAAEIARETAADASLQLQMARSTLTKAVREEFERPDRAALLSEIQQALEKLDGQVGYGFATAAAVADRRAVGIRDAIIAMVDIEVAQIEMLETTVNRFGKVERTRPRRRAPSAKRASSR